MSDIVDKKTESVDKKVPASIEKFSVGQIESIFSAILHYTDFPILIKKYIGESFTKEEWIEIFFTDLEKDLTWPQ